MSSALPLRACVWWPDSALMPLCVLIGKVRDLYKGVIRIFWKGNHVLIAATNSPFALRHRRPDGIVLFAAGS